MKLGLLFPGQGAQAIGMGHDFTLHSPAAKAVFEEADAVLGYALSKLCFDGPAEELTRTDIAQPAIYTCSLAAFAAFEEAFGKVDPQGTAGLSLGEYSAMAAAGAFSFADGLQLVHLRGKAMQDASEMLTSGMTSVLGLAPEALRELCEQAAAATGKICQVANLNCPGQVVISGEIEALEALEPLVKEAGARRAIRLTVAGAFHSDVMQPAAARLNEALAETPIQTPKCPVWQNATAKPASSPEELREGLSAQLTAPVLWADSFFHMAQELSGVTFLELAPGKVLTGLGRKIYAEAMIHALPNVSALESLANTLSPPTSSSS